MADHPAGIHLEARRHCLGMQAPAGDGGEAVVHALEYLVPHKTGAEALRPVELEVIALRLGVPVGQIAGPVPPVVQHLAQHHIGPGGDILVKDGVYPALGHIAELAHAGVDPGGVLRPVQPAGERCVILRALDQDLRVCLRLHGDLLPGASMEGIGAVSEHVSAADRLRPALPAEGHGSGQKQHRGLLAPAAKVSLPAGFHPVDPDVHQHIAVCVVVGTEDFLALRVKLRIAEYVFHV